MNLQGLGHVPDAINTNLAINQNSVLFLSIKIQKQQERGDSLGFCTAIRMPRVPGTARVDLGIWLGELSGDCSTLSAKVAARLQLWWRTYRSEVKQAHNDKGPFLGDPFHAEVTLWALALVAASDAPRLVRWICVLLEARYSL